ncbi:hypothetical protein AAHC03_022991 [Spirometra sp. Aus1]
MSADDSEIISLLQINPLKRTVEDLTRLFQHLRSIEGLVGTGPSTHRDAALREICRIARLLRAKGDTMLYRKGDPTDCWYILLTGSVLIESSMFLPRNCFGTRLNASLYRQHDCFVLEESDLIVIDYIDREATIATPGARKTSASLANNGISENVHVCATLLYASCFFVCFL